MIEARGLTKWYGRLAALSDVSFDVGVGEAVALWGANGAGKTTVLHSALSLIPYEGSITVAGLDVKREGKAVRRLVGFVPQELSFHDDMTVEETVTFYALLKKVESGHDFTSLLTDLKLNEHIEKRVGALSGGMKQRLALALALIADPPILLLDEPTASLDIRSRENFLYLLQRLRSVGKTLFFSSHRFDEVVSLADRVLLLESGKVVADAPPDKLEQQLGRPITMHLSMPSKGIETAIEALADHGISASVNGRGVRVHAAPGQKGHLLHLLHEAGVVVDDFTVE